MATPKKARKTKKEKNVSSKPQEQQKHPAEWSDDLNPHRMEGQNIGASSKSSNLLARTAADLDVLAGRLDNFSRDELSQIPIVPVGTKLKQGAVYLDMRIPAPVPFTATADTAATELNYYTPKAEIPYELWDRLVEALGPTSMGEGSKGTQENKPFSPGRAAQESAVEERRGFDLRHDNNSDPKIDEALAQSFPASDPPAWTIGREENDKSRTTETAGDDLQSLSDHQLHEKARQLHIETSALSREQVILAIRGQLSGTEV
jgi:hypothetical protein